MHALVSPYIAAVNPMTAAILQISDGSTIAADGSRTPKYRVPTSNVSAQVQPLSSKDLRQIEGLNLQGYVVAVYLSGELDGLVRVQNKGGDLITIATGVHAGVYLVSMVLEQYPDWVKVAATLQNDSKVGC
jgi:hypothetical protein